MTAETRGRTDRAGVDASWFGLGPVNWALLGAAAVVIVVGYVLLDRGSVTAAPLLLTLGYVVLVPGGLLWGYRERRDPE